jgi:LacI family transcriptional regulator
MNPFSKRDHTGSIGFVCSNGHIDTHDPWMREVFRGLTSGFAKHSRNLLLHDSVLGQSAYDALVRILENKVDGLILMPGREDRRLVEIVKDSAIPALTLFDPLEDLPMVCADDASGSAQIAMHLWVTGHRHILYRRSARRFRHEQVRYTAFYEVIRNLGGEVTPAEAFDDLDSVSDYEQSLLFNLKSQEITAIACWRDYSAMRVLNFCTANRLSVPSDIAVSGFDGLPNLPIPEGLHLTTVDPQWRALARLSTDVIEAIIAGDSYSHRTTLPVTLIEGNTA